MGVPGKRPYNACHSLPARVRFARYAPQPLISPAAVSGIFDPEERAQLENNITVSLPQAYFGRNDAATIPQRVEGDSGSEQHPSSQMDAAAAMEEDPDDSSESNEQDISDEEDYKSDSDQTSIHSEHLDRHFKPDTELIDRLLRNNLDDVSLHVKGFTLGEVKFCTDEIADGVIPATAVLKLRRTKNEDPDKLWKTLVAERDDHAENPPPWSETAADLCLKDPSPNGHINTRELLRKRQSSWVRKFLKRVQQVIWNRSFLEVNRGSTQDMLHGFGPGDVRKGDVVCILFGCSVPCILRKGSDARIPGVYYRFIGEAYLYGIMDGEEVTRRSKHEMEVATEEFRLL